MFGYVRPSLRRLSPEDQELFQAVYCGLCRTLGERYGVAARFILNYDLAFLAVLLSEGDRPETGKKNCIAHPLKKRVFCPAGSALDLAADYSVILSWWQLKDALADEKRALKYRAAAAALRAAYDKARQLHPDFDRCTCEHLGELARLEEEKCASMDRAADTFARLLQGAAGEVDEPMKRRVLEQMLYHLGRWIYLVDAVDDLEKDFQNGSYNPLIYRFDLKVGRLSEQERETVAFSLDHSIRQMAAAFELWDFGAWSGIIKATVYEGLFGVGRSVFEGRFHAVDRGVALSGRDEEQV